jgi:hypothetical protein
MFGFYVGPRSTLRLAKAPEAATPAKQRDATQIAPKVKTAPVTKFKAPKAQKVKPAKDHSSKFKPAKARRA